MNFNVECIYASNDVIPTNGFNSTRKKKIKEPCETYGDSVELNSNTHTKK